MTDPITIPPDALADTDPAPAVGASLPADASPDILIHQWCPIVLASLAPDVALADARDYLYRALHAVDGLGAAEWVQRPGGAREPMPGRNGAYRDAIAFGEDEADRVFMAPLAPDHGEHAWNRSSCGRLVRATLGWVLGIRAHGLMPPYQSGMVMSDLEALYRHHGAWVDAHVPGADGEWALPEVGDCVFYSPQHVELVTGTLADGTVLAVAGGRGGGNDGGSEIAALTRTFTARGTAVVAGAKSVRGWGKLAPLLPLATEGIVLPMRVGG